MIKLEKTSNLIEALVEQHGVVIWNEEIKQMAEESDAELNEVVRLADIGRVTEKAFEEGYYFVLEDDDCKIVSEIYKCELLEWAKGGK